jgi:hypothetical protein
MKLVTMLSAFMISHMINLEVYNEYMNGSDTRVITLLTTLIVADELEFIL